MLTVILEFRFLECKQSEPVICVSHPLFAVKMLRIFGHLIVNLSVDYHLFYLGDTKPMNMMEDYLAEYCSQTLYQLSIQNSTLIHEALEDMQKPLTGVKTLQIQYCTFGKNFTFNKVFPNLQTLKSGSNSYLYSSVIIAHHPTLKHLTIRFDDQIQEDNIIKLFQLNPQLGNSKICFFRDSIGFDSFPRLKQCFPSLQKINRYYYNPLHIHTFFCYGNIYERRDRYKYPNNLSNGYKNELENLYVFCSKNIYGQKVEKKIFR